MTTRKTTALILGIFLGIAVAALMTWAARAPLELVYLLDDFSDRKIMKDDPKEPEPQKEEVVFFPAVVEEVRRTTEPDPEPPARIKPHRPPDPLEKPGARPGAYDRLPSK